MHKIGFMTGVLVGAVAVGYWYWMKNYNAEKSSVPTPVKSTTAMQGATQSFVGQDLEQKTFVDEGFTTATMKDFNIVMPPVQASAKVKAKAAKLTEGRFAIINSRINPPVYL